MQFSSRLSTAVHILLYLIEYENEEKINSKVLADTTGVNAVNIRKVLALFKSAGLIRTRAGIGGTYLSRKPEEITLGTVFRAVEETDSKLFRPHGHPNVNCPVGRTIQSVLDGRVSKIREVMLKEMDCIYLSDLYIDMQEKIQKEK